MRAVLDTHVIISATLIRGGNEGRILRAWRRDAFELVLSPPILEEMGRALCYERLEKYRWMSDEEIVELLRMLAQECILVMGKIQVEASRDPEDDKFLAAAIEGQARYVVTGDKDLLAVGRCRGVQVITPRAFLRVLGMGKVPA